jgi:biotin carboxyl carrier protein
MKRIARCCAAAMWLLAAGTTRAHDEGPPHREASSPTTPDRPGLTPDGRLFLPKTMQHRLGIRTQPASDGILATRRLTGEVIAHPDAPGVISAPEPGRLEAATSGWPVSGQHVNAGDALAELLPLMSERDRAQRRAALAGIEQKRNLARVNNERMRLQSDSRGGIPASENTYLEQAQTDLATQERLYQLATESLQGRVVLRAMASGTLTATRVRPGDVVAAGTPLFDIGGAARVRIAADVWDARIAQHLRAARLDGASAAAVPLTVRGVEPQPAGSGWRLLLDAPLRPDHPLLPGQLVSVLVDVAPSEATCARDAPHPVWIHLEPEVFERRVIAGCDHAGLAAGERVVVSGAALLDEYR